MTCSRVCCCDGAPSCLTFHQSFPLDSLFHTLQGFFVKSWINQLTSRKKWTISSMSGTLKSHENCLLYHGVVSLGCYKHFIHFCSCFTKFQTELHICISQIFCYFSHICKVWQTRIHTDQLDNATKGATWWKLSKHMCKGGHHMCHLSVFLFPCVLLHWCHSVNLFVKPCISFWVKVA